MKLVDLSSKVYIYQTTQYDYTYDNLGNITEEKYREMAQGSSVFVDIITRKYIYDDLNQLIQESVHNSQVDCNNTSNIHACYLKIYEYDKLGNLIRQKTLKYLNTNNLVKVTTSTPYSNGDMIFKYNGSSQYYTPYVIPVGGSINLSFSFYDITEFPPELITSPVSVTLNTSNVDTSSPGIYLLTGTAYASGYGYTLQFGIIVNVGNIVVVNQVNYSYTNAWKDQLSSYTVVTNGVSKTSAITYDNQGNPTVITNFFYGGTKYNHANLKWEGRQLVNIKVYSSSNDTVKVGEIWYSYNDQGIRVRKTIDSNGDGITNLKYDYIMVGDQLLAEIVFEKVSGIWEEIYQIHYLYEHDGSAIGFQYFTPSSSPSTYLYIRNIQGDVTKIVDPDGYVVVRYEYDAYGNILSMTGSHANTLGKHNSLTYRSYKYDREINLYYLNSRYYNPEIGRFISSDGLLGPVGNILGHNMYSYTQNNPVMYTDTTGYFMVGVMIVSIIVSLIIESIQDYTDDGVLFNRSFNNYIGAGVSGFFSGLSGGPLYLMLYGFIGNSLDYFISGEFNPETFGKDLFFMGISSAMGVVIGKGLNLGLSKLKANSLFKLNNNPLANDILNKMGLTVKIGSRAAEKLGRVIFNSRKYLLGEIMENLASNITNNYLRFD